MYNSNNSHDSLNTLHNDLKELLRKHHECDIVVSGISRGTLFTLGGRDPSLGIFSLGLEEKGITCYEGRVIPMSFTIPITYDKTITELRFFTHTEVVNQNAVIVWAVEFYYSSPEGVGVINITDTDMLDTFREVFALLYVRLQKGVLK